MCCADSWLLCDHAWGTTETALRASLSGAQAEFVLGDQPDRGCGHMDRAKQNMSISQTRILELNSFVGRGFGKSVGTNNKLEALAYTQV